MRVSGVRYRLNLRKRPRKADLSHPDPAISNLFEQTSQIL
jgi:hypothetical protein